jgi:DNA-binding MarR family transcriptional regulator
MYKDLNPLLHQQLRLAIVSLLVKNNKMDFTALKKETKATAGNLSVQIKKLEEADYIKITKTFKDNYPLTTAQVTKAGLEAFEEYVRQLKKYIQL